MAVLQGICGGGDLGVPWLDWGEFGGLMVGLGGMGGPGGRYLGVT